MKKVFLTLVPTFILVACTTQAPETYNTMEYTSYNLNPEAKELILKNEVTNASIRLIELSNSYVVKDSNSDFRIELDNNGQTGRITNTNGEKREWNGDKGYKIFRKNVADTLVVSYLPTDETPSSVLKFGGEYKFYNK